MPTLVVLPRTRTWPQVEEPAWGGGGVGRHGAKAKFVEYPTTMEAGQDLGSRRALRWPGASVSEETCEKKRS